LISKLKNRFVLTCLILVSTSLFSQNKIVDSLNNALKHTLNDSIRLRLYYQLCVNCDIKDNLRYGEQGIKVADNLIALTKNEKLRASYLKQRAEIYNLVAVYFERTEKSGSKNQFNYLKKALESFKEAKDTVGITNSIVSFSEYYYRDGNIMKQLEELQNGLNLWKACNYKKGMARFIKEIGFLYANQGDTIYAMDYLEKGLVLEKEIGDKSRINRGYYLIASFYARLKNYDKAIFYYLKAIEKYTNSTEANNLPEIYLELGEAYQAKRNYTEAIASYDKGYELSKQVKDSRIKFLTTIAKGNLDLERGKYKEAIRQHLENYNFATKLTENFLAQWLSSSALSKDYFAIGDFKQAKYYSSQALSIMKKNGTVLDILNEEKMAYRIDSATDNFKEAHLHYLQYIKLRDQLNTVEVKKAAAREKFQYELEAQKKQSKQEQERKDEVNKKENRNKNRIIMAVSFGLFLVLILAVIIFRGLKQNQKINKILVSKNELIENQKRLVDNKQKEILDSIKYASRIQKALLPTEKYIERILDDLKDKKPD
jgi:tetratricopeptide (TPR) repeat protein